MGTDEVVRHLQPEVVPRNMVAEVEFAARRDWDDPTAEVEVDFEFTGPDGDPHLVPAFWAGGRCWRARYSSGVEGVHHFRAVVRSKDETGLETVRGQLRVGGYSGANPLFLHGAPKIADDHRKLAYADGTPFFWLADTWWTAFTERFRWPGTFTALARDRAAKGFTVIQLVAGLQPEMVPFSDDMKSEGGQPWLEHGKGQLNPAYYAVPDNKIDCLVSLGLVPCIVGGWGYYAEQLGAERLRRHWRYLVARYGAYPVIWCIAGEVDLLFSWQPLLEGRIVRPSGEEAGAARAAQIEKWESASNHVKEIDPFHRVRTVHETSVGASGTTFVSRGSFDLDMLQTGHFGTRSVPNSLRALNDSLAHGDKPALVGECSYEGIFDGNWHDLQRFLFWSHLLSGAAGHTYGTMAICILNTKSDPRFPLTRVSMHYWEDAIAWLGAAHVAVGKRILERFRWSELSPSQESVQPHASEADWFLPYCGALPDGTLIIYQPSMSIIAEPDWQRFRRLVLTDLEPSTFYDVNYVDPRTGDNVSSPGFTTVGPQQELTSDHSWVTPTGEDWVLVVSPKR